MSEKKQYAYVRTRNRTRVQRFVESRFRLLLRKTLPDFSETERDTWVPEILFPLHVSCSSTRCRRWLEDDYRINDSRSRFRRRSRSRSPRPRSRNQKISYSPLRLELLILLFDLPNVPTRRFHSFLRIEKLYFSSASNFYF